MSLFLGPIHYLMQSRVLFLEQQTDALKALALREGWLAEEALAAVDEFCPRAAEAPLETIIDTSNIHGWLSAAVEGAETRFATVVTLILAEHPERLAALEACLTAQGEAAAFPALEDCEDVWQMLQQRLLDGMPCDFPFQMTEEGPAAVRWVLRQCPHERFFSEVPGGVATFYTLRTALVKGLLAASPSLSYRRLADGSFEIVKE